MIFPSFAFVFACTLYLGLVYSQIANQSHPKFAYWPNSTTNETGPCPRILNSTTKPPTCPAACDVYFNYCDAYTAPTCIYPNPGAPEIRSACACRPGYKATGFADSDISQQWRLPVTGQTHRVWVAERVRCDTLCTISWGIDSCQEVELVTGACKNPSTGNETERSKFWARQTDEEITYEAADGAGLNLPPVTPPTDSQTLTFVRRQDNATVDDFRPGTNTNVEGLTPDTGGVNLVAIDWTSDMSSGDSEPYAQSAECSSRLVYQSVVGDDVNFYPGREDLNWHYIRQSGLGDCAFGASLLSILQTQNANTLRARFDRDPSGQLFSATFFKPGSTQTMQTVLVDNKLPLKAPEETKNCRYISFQSYQGTLFVPLLEKTLAKYVDNYHNDLRNPNLLAHGFVPEVYGINGLEGISGGKVIQSLVGGTARGVFRPYSGDAGAATLKIQAALTDCLSRNIPCTCGTPSLFDPKNNGAQFIWGLPNQQEIPGGNGRKTAALFDGWVVNNMPLSVQGGDIFEVVNQELGQRYAMVGGHAYSVSRGIRRDTVILGNPWGYTPNDPITGEPHGWQTSRYDAPNNTPFYEMPLTLAASFLAGVEWSL